MHKSSPPFVKKASVLTSCCVIKKENIKSLTAIHWLTRPLCCTRHAISLNDFINNMQHESPLPQSKPSQLLFIIIAIIIIIIICAG